jgi:uncharacterized protein (TIGR02246 family)
MLLQTPRRTAFLLVLLALACAVLGLRGGIGIDSAKAQQASPPKSQAADRPEDREAIRSAMRSFVKAFESRDAKALAGHWTTGGEFTNEAGLTVRGREALEKAFSEVLAKTPEAKAEVHPESLRFLSSGSAIEEGSVTVRRGSAEPTTRARYKVFLVREQGSWLFAQMGESPGGDASVADLAWLIGEWKSTGGQGAEIRTTYSWAPNKKFIHADFSIKEKELALGGFQVIGVDPATGSLHTWTFEADGGIGEADWNPDGDHWVLDAAGTLSDGSTLTETNILRRVNDDTFTWQSVDRTYGDAELSDLAPVKVTRVKPGK